jgi:ATP-dependent protease ClpP protease subunit
MMIQSGGGYVSLGNDMIEALNSLREAGVKVNCYVGEAQSMAFAIMVLTCDKVIAKKGSTLMQHRVSYGSAGYTPSTYQSDIELSRRESQSLGVKYDEWHNLVRGSEDHIFTKEEIEKYKLVDEWMD